jgi:uncharacterized membrane protein YczE
LRSVLRPAVAGSVMAAVLVWAGLGWNSWDSEHAGLSIALAKAVGLGAVVYTVALMGQWLAVGRPVGPETDTVLLIKRMLHRK